LLELISSLAMIMVMIDNLTMFSTIIVLCCPLIASKYRHKLSFCWIQLMYSMMILLVVLLTVAVLLHIMILMMILIM